MSKLSILLAIHISCVTFSVAKAADADPSTAGIGETPPTDVPSGAEATAAQPAAAPIPIPPITWEIIGPESMADFILALNTPEQIEKRRLDAMMLLAPEVYFKLFPKTGQQLALEQDALNRVLRPRNLKEKQAEQTREQNDRDEAIAKTLVEVIVLPPIGTPTDSSPGIPTKAEASD